MLVQFGIFGVVCVLLASSATLAVDFGMVSMALEYVSLILLVCQVEDLFGFRRFAKR